MNRDDFQNPKVIYGDLKRILNIFYTVRKLLQAKKIPPPSPPPRGRAKGWGVSIQPD
jgi:hypothetical protein